MTEKEKIIEKIKKAQALADGGVGGEAINAAKMVAKLMAKHAISHNDLIVDDTDELGQFEYSCSQSGWARQLLDAIAKFCQCRATFVTGTKVANIWGYQEDTEVAKYLFQVTFAEINRLCSESGVSGRKEMNRWRMSAVWGFKEKLKTLSKDMEIEDGWAIVVSRASDVEEYMQNSGLKFGTTTGTSYSKNSDAYEQGKKIQVRQGIKETKRNLIA